MPLTVDLGPLEAFVQRVVREGHYADADAAIRTALRLLEAEFRRRDDFVSAMEEEVARGAAEDVLAQSLRAGSEDALLRLIARYPRTPPPTDTPPEDPKPARGPVPWLRHD